MYLRSFLYSIFIILIPILLYAYPGEVIESFPAPGNFSTGMTFDGTHLWVADYKTDKLYRIDIETGEIKRKISSPGFWPKGLAWDGKYLWNVDSKQKLIFQIDPNDGTILKTIYSPTDYPDGLTWDGETLWLSDYKKKKIMKLDLNDGTAIKTYTAPSKYPQGLTYDGTYLWCADRRVDEIYMVEPSNGEVVNILNSPGKYPRGLAYDGKYIWNVDYQSDSLYKIVRQDDEKYILSETRKTRVTITNEVKVYGKGKVKDLDVYIAVPEVMPQQDILEIIYSPPNNKIEQDKWNQRIAVFNYLNIPSETSVESIMEVDAEISEIRYFIFPDQCGTIDDIPEEIRTLYTANGSKYMIDDEYIQKRVKEISGDEENPYWLARKIFDFVRNILEYKLEGGWNVAPFVLQRGTGSCSEYTFSFISLCRAAGIPARYVGAIVVRGDDASLDEVFHRWPEVYLPNYGWIPMDPQGGDKPLPRDRAMNIGNLSNRFLITTQGGGDSEYLGWYYNHNEKYQTDPQVQVNVETFGEWEPIKE
jgi:sugar lactone lactonase YvrE